MGRSKAATRIQDSSPTDRSRNTTDSSTPKDRMSATAGSGLRFSETRNLGDIEGVNVQGKISVDVDDLISKQGVKIEFDATNKTVGFGANLGSTQSKLGVNIGGKVQINDDGSVAIKSSTVGLNIAGFGGEVQTNDDNTGRISVSVAGARVGIGIGEKGAISLSLGYSVPGGSVEITFTPDGEKDVPIDTPVDSPPPAPVIEIPTPNDQVLPPGVPRIPVTIPPIRDPTNEPGIDDSSSRKWCTVVIKVDVQQRFMTDWGPGYRFGDIIDIMTTVSDRSVQITYSQKHWNSAELELNYTKNSSKGGNFTKPFTWGRAGKYITAGNPGRVCYVSSIAYYDFWDTSSNTSEGRFFATVLQGDESAISDYISRTYERIDSRCFLSRSGITYFANIPTVLRAGDPTNKVYPSGPRAPNNESYALVDYLVTVLESSCLLPNLQPPSVKAPTFKKVPTRLPNQPQKYKPMNCCNKVEEIYKFFGIAKIKKNKFKVAKQFLSPGGTGNEVCEDYYEVQQALFRMLANGLILNPISKPHGSEWQNVNATAWASQVYEMLAESMSDGNSTQKYEVAAIMHSVQTFKVLAELVRKVELLIDTFGIQPVIETELLPTVFTIHEAHKGFDKKDSREIDIGKAKTDNEVEAVLAKMLKPSKIPITKWAFDPNSVSVFSILNNR